MAGGVRPRDALGRAPLRRSALKSIHWIDLTGFAGRASPLTGSAARLFLGTLPGLHREAGARNFVA